MQPIEFEGHTIALEEFNRVRVTAQDRGSIHHQTVEAILMLAILVELRKLNETKPKRKKHE